MVLECCMGLWNKNKAGVFMDNNEKKIYTIDDIAHELGVSKTTVSRAISGKGRIGQMTRERVLKFIEEHDYRPNVLARGLAQKKTYNLALLLPKDYAATEFPFFKDCMNGICEAASENDYDIIISMLGENDLSQLQRLISNRKVDGVIVSRATGNSAEQHYLKENHIPFVVIGPSPDSDDASVDNKNREASEELTSILLMKGIRRLAIFGGREDYNVTGSRYSGYVDAHKKAGIYLDESLSFMNMDDQLKVSCAVEKALQKQTDGILCMDDVICTMVLNCLREKRIKIPNEYKVASLYDSRNLEYNNPSVTSVRFDTVRLGRIACMKLLKLLGEEVEEDTAPLSYQVILRESTQSADIAVKK